MGRSLFEVGRSHHSKINNVVAQFRIHDAAQNFEDFRFVDGLGVHLHKGSYAVLCDPTTFIRYNEVRLRTGNFKHDHRYRYRS